MPRRYPPAYSLFRPARGSIMIVAAAYFAARVWPRSESELFKEAENSSCCVRNGAVMSIPVPSECIRVTNSKILVSTPVPGSAAHHSSVIWQPRDTRDRIKILHNSCKLIVLIFFFLKILRCREIAMIRVQTDTANFKNQVYACS